MTFESWTQSGAEISLHGAFEAGRAEAKAQIADLERQRDTAHAAAIQAAANLVDKEQRFEFGVRLDNEDIRGLRDSILAITLATSLRLYDLRIKEAVRDALIKYSAPNVACPHDEEVWYCDCCKFDQEKKQAEMLVSTSAEVERLKAQEVNTKGESA